MDYCHGSAPLQAWALQEPEGKKAVQNNGAEMVVLEGNGEMIVASEKQSISLSPLWQWIIPLILPQAAGEVAVQPFLSLWVELTT